MNQTAYEAESTPINPMSILFDKLLYNSDISYYELEKRTGIDRGNLRRMATGRIAMSMESAEKIATALDINVEYFSTAYFQTTGMPLPTLQDFLRARFHWITYKDCREVETLVIELASNHGLAPSEKEMGTERPYYARSRARRATSRKGTEKDAEPSPNDEES
ncbi:helix-turn-helix domain-containing protein [Nocardia brasiliensis]